MKKHFRVLSTFASILILSAVLLFACKKDNKSLESNEDLIAARLKMKAVNNSDKTLALQSIVNKIKQAGSYYASVSTKLDLESAKLLFNESEKKYVALFPFRNDTTKSYSIYGYVAANEYITDGEVLISLEKNADESYTKYIVKNQEAFTATVTKNGTMTYQDLNVIPSEKWDIIQTTDCQGRHGGTGFCQREPGESFGACHRAEVDEFTDDFLGWLYYHANQILVDATIAAACACSATQCPK